MFHRFVKILSALFVMCSLCGCGATSNGSRLKDFQDFSITQRIEDFSWISAIFDEHYAMLDYKQQRLGFKWGALKDEYRNKIAADGLSREAFGSLMQEFVAKMQDGHTAALSARDAQLEGSRVMTLGFKTAREIKDGKNLAKVTIVYSNILGDSASSPIKVGDTLVALDGRDIEAVMREDILRYRDVGQPEANISLSIGKLANRSNSQFAQLPSGFSDVKILRDGKEVVVHLPWIKASVWDLYDGNSPDSKVSYGKVLDRRADGTLLVEETRWEPMTIDNLASRSRSRSPYGPNMHLAFMPDVAFENFLSGGDVISKDYPKATSDVTLDNLPFKLLNTAKGLVAIYRVEDFVDSRQVCKHITTADDGNGMKINISTCHNISGADYAGAFNKLKNLGVKALILDLRSNGGGSMETGYELVRAFVRGSITTNLASVRLNESWLAQFKEGAADSNNLATKQAYQQAYATLRHDIANGRRLSSPVAIMGSSNLLGVAKPWEQQTYILVDELCASMCDIFATLMQDYKLATVIGKQSMGAGGNVQNYQYSPHTQLALSQTESIIYRRDGSPIENEGAKPDIATSTTTGEDFWRQVKSGLETRL